MIIVKNFWWPCTLLLLVVSTESAPQRPPPEPPQPETYHVQNNDKSYQFGYQTKDHYHHGDGTRDNFVRGEFGARNPATGVVDSVSYTAGPRGFRPRGKNIARKYDLSQVGPRPAGGKPGDPLFDNAEDPSYNFGFRTRTYNREEGANRLGDVTGRYSFVDDIGERHNVEYIAGKNTGFHVRTPYPDSNPSSIGPLFYKGPGKPGEKPRGRTSIQRGLDGSYKFVSAGPDQRRTESSDATGHVRGSYTFIDDKGVQHTVHYIAGPETGYRVLKNVKAPHFPNWYPLEPSRPSRPPSLPPGPGARPGLPPPPDFGGEDYGDGDKNIEDIFGGPQEQLSTAASGHAKPSKPPGFGSAEKEDKTPPFDNDFGGSFDEAVGGRPGGSTARPPFNGGGPQKPSFLDEDGGGGFLPSTTRRPFGGGPSKPSFLDEDEEGGFGARPGRPGSTRPPFGAGGGGTKPFLDEDLQGDFFPKPSSTRKPFGGGSGQKPFDETGPGGFGTTGGATGGGPGGPSSAQTDGDFMDDLFKPSGPTGGGGGGPSRDEGPKRPSRPQDFGFEGGPSRPSSTRPPFPDELPKPFDEGGASTGDDFELFGGDKGKPSGRPTFTGSKEDMNYGFFDGKGPTSRPPQRPTDDFFGDKGPSSTARPGGGRPFDFFDEDKGGRPPKRPPTGAGGSKDDFDFFGNSNVDKGSTARPFRPTPGGNIHDDGYSFTQREPAPSRPSAIPSRPSFSESQPSRPPSIPSRPPYIPESQPSRPPSRPSYPESEPSRPPSRPPYPESEPGRPPSRPSYPESEPSRPPYIPESEAGRPPSRPPYIPESEQGRPPSRPPYIPESEAGRPPSRPPYIPEGERQPPGEISGSINVAYDGKVTILTNIGDKHISFPPGVAVKAYVQSIDFLPYGSRIPSPSEQLKSESQINNDISVQPLKRQLFPLNESKQILTINESPEISVQPLRKNTRDINENSSIPLQNDSFPGSIESSEEAQNEVQQYKRETIPEENKTNITLVKPVLRQKRIKLKNNEIKSDND